MWDLDNVLPPGHAVEASSMSLQLGPMCNSPEASSTVADQSEHSSVPRCSYKKALYSAQIDL